MVNPATTSIQPKRKRQVQWAFNAILVFVGILVLVALAGACYQFVEAALDARKFPQVGKSVDIGGYRLNIKCTGQDGPTTILESGLEDQSIDWSVVQGEIAKFTHVCSYDRAGYGWSSPGPMPRTSMQIAKELHTLLQNAGEKPPYVLVGHSFGAVNVRVYNGLYPSDVAGMVLADGGSEEVKLPTSIQKLSDADLKRRQQARKWAVIRYRLGISRFEARKEIENTASPFGDREWYYFSIQPKFVAAATSEVENSLDPQGVETLKAGTLGDKPLIVLIAGKGMWGLPLTSQDWVDLQHMWIEDQKRLAQRLSQRGKWILIPDSTHMIPDDRPDAIVSAVREISTTVGAR
jgi:pimeloyl-ACP methyl ester carboxylesterase